jgi:hypothetical protein
MGWSFIVYNEGVPGTYPSIRPFHFFALNISQWPNVICIEPCLNCGGNDHYHCSLSIDNMKYFINGQYEQNGLDSPDYLFLEFFQPAETSIVNEFNLTSNDIKIPSQLNASNADSSVHKSMSANNMRGNMFASKLLDMARFYGFPLLSVTDVLFPSWVRFFLTHADNERWPYTADGSHTSPEGCKVVADHILKPFFVNQMSPRESDKLYMKSPAPFGPYPVDVRMFRQEAYKVIHIIGND